MRVPWRPEEPIRTPGAVFTSCCTVPKMGAEYQTQGLCKNSEHLYPLSPLTMTISYDVDRGTRSTGAGGLGENDFGFRTIM